MPRFDHGSGTIGFSQRQNTDSDDSHNDHTVEIEALPNGTYEVYVSHQFTNERGEWMGTGSRSVAPDRQPLIWRVNAAHDYSMDASRLGGSPTAREAVWMVVYSTTS